MNFNRKFFVAAGASALVLAAGSAAFADEPVFGGTTGSAPVTTTTNNTPVTTVAGGSETSAPFQTFVTTTTPQTVNSTTAPTTTGVSASVGGNTYTGTITVSGQGSQNQTQAVTATTTWNPGPPPTPTGPPVNTTVITTGAQTITAVSASGSVGTMATPSFGAVLSSGGFVSANAVSATENDVFQDTSGVTYSTYQGTATYDPGTGNVIVSLPSTATSSTSIGSGGISTSGTISASTVSATTVSAGSVFADLVSANEVDTNKLVVSPGSDGVSIDAGGGKISNLANGTAPGDAVNLAQLQAGLNNFRKQAASGTAVAAAMSGAYFLPGKRFSITGNLSDYLGEGAFAFDIGYLITPNIALNASVASAFSYGGTAGRIGATYGF
jgi:hypothetical protein